MDNNNTSSDPIDVDLNSSDFYNKMQDEIEYDTARLKKSVEIVRNLRLVAAEMEVETAALFHAELFHKIEELKLLSDTFNREDNNENLLSQTSV